MGSVERSKLVVIDARSWQKGKGESPTKTKRTSKCSSSIIDNSACAEVTTYPSNLWRLLDQSVFRRLSQIGKAGEAWDGIGLEGERASLLRGGDLKYRRSSKDTQLPVSVVRNGSGVEVDGEVIE